MGTFILLSCVINLLLFTYGCKLLDFNILSCRFIIVCTRYEINLPVFYVKSVFFCVELETKKKAVRYFSTCTQL